MTDDWASIPSDWVSVPSVSELKQARRSLLGEVLKDVAEHLRSTDASGRRSMKYVPSANVEARDIVGVLREKGYTARIYDEDQRDGTSRYIAISWE